MFCPRETAERGERDPSQERGPRALQSKASQATEPLVDIMT